MNTMLTKAITALFGTKPKSMSPVQWRFAVRGGVHNIYKVHITAFINDKWRLAAAGPTSGGPLPTTIEFEDSRDILVHNGPETMGHVKKAHNRQNGTVTNYYTHIINYVQEVYAFSVPATLKGKISYMPFTEKQCLDLMEHPFDIGLG
jgi:hypothetical protein